MHPSSTRRQALRTEALIEELMEDALEDA
jgi:hypothetical protein